MREGTGAPLLVADSFRVRTNPLTRAAEVRGWHLHLERFARSVESVLDERATLPIEDFLSESATRIAEYGAGFPRLELLGIADHSPSLHLSLRPLPTLTETLELRSTGHLRLEAPWLKGPNLVRLMDLNRELGAEALLLDPAGRALEGATTSLIWWAPESDRGFRVAVTPDDSVGPRSRVDSVAERLTASIAQHLGTPLVEARLVPAELARHEVWAVNALHGIRAVTAIDGMPTARPDRHRLLRFQEALDRTWQPVTGSRNFH
ncbi:aminotransferase class IV [Leucobacter sp. GX24907]